MENVKEPSITNNIGVYGIGFDFIWLWDAFYGTLPDDYWINPSTMDSRHFPKLVPRRSNERNHASLTSTIPWSICVALAVLWGVCWMFHDPGNPPILPITNDDEEPQLGPGDFSDSIWAFDAAFNGGIEFDQFPPYLLFTWTCRIAQP